MDTLVDEKTTTQRKTMNMMRVMRSWVMVLRKVSAFWPLPRTVSPRAHAAIPMAAIAVMMKLFQILETILGEAA